MGDSGRPFAINNQLVGGVSWGKRKYPGVYTNVAYYRVWINKNMI